MKRTLLLSSLILLFFSFCHSIPFSPVTEHNNNVPLFIAHRGSRFITCENTIHGFETALQLEADVIEMDARLTKDNVLIIYHDDFLNRTTNWPGFIRNYTYAELSNLLEIDPGYNFTHDMGKTFPFRGWNSKYPTKTPLQIPTVRQVFERFWGTPEQVLQRKQKKDSFHPQHVFINIELKEEDPLLADKMIEETIGRYDTEWVQQHLNIANAWCPPMEYFRKKSKYTIPTSACEGEALSMVLKSKLWSVTPKLLQNIVFPKPTPEPGALLHHPTTYQVPLHVVGVRLDTKEYIDLVHHFGKTVSYWVINDKKTMKRLIDMGADGIFTDRADLLKSVYDELNMTSKRWRVKEDPYEHTEFHDFYEPAEEEDEPHICVGFLCYAFENFAAIAISSIVLFLYITLRIVLRFCVEKRTLPKQGQKEKFE